LGSLLSRGGIEEAPGSGAALERMLLYMEEAWPWEACGALFVLAAGAWAWQPMENVACCPRQAFVFGEGWLSLLCEAEQRQSTLVCLAHSHPGGEAQLSPADLQSLAPEGILLWPQVWQVVVATGEEGWRELSWFEPQGGGFECKGRWSRACFEARKKGRSEL